MKKETSSVSTRTLIVFIVLLASSMITSFVQTALNTAQTPIMNEMGIAPSTVQWLTSGYSLAMGITVLATAFLIRRFKTKRLYAAAMGAFILGTLCAAIANQFALLMIARLLQAVGCGILMSLTQVVILTIIPVAKKGTYMGIYGLAVCGAPVLAPTLAGIIIDHSNWHMIFWISLVIAVVIYVLALIFMTNCLETEELHFDLLSMILCSVGFTGLLIGLGNMGQITSLQFWLPIIIGIVFLVIFVRKQLSQEQPFLELRILKNREFCIALIASIILYLTMMATSTIVPIYTQSMLEFSPTVSGLIMLPGSLITAVVSLIAGRLYDKMGIRKLYLVGTLILVISAALFCTCSLQSSVIQITIYFAIRNLGIGMLMMPSVTWGMSTMEKRFTSDGTALLMSIRTIAGAFGSALFIAIMTLASHGAQGPKMIGGLRVSFIGMAIPCVVLFVVAILFVGKETTEKA